MSDEHIVQQQVRLAASQMGWLMWRNNVGACIDQTGRHIRYGIANDSQRINTIIKSSDLIGIVPVTVTPDMVGRTLGVFTGIECKRSDWRGVSNERETAQARFIELVRSNGGYGGFVTSPGDLMKIG